MNSSYDFGDPQNDHLGRIARAQQDAYGLSALGMMAHDRYAMCNASSFYPGELEKLRENDRKLDDCRTRRKVAILRISRMVQNLDNG